MNVFDSLLDVPLDEQDPSNDGDDSLVPATALPYSAPFHLPPLQVGGLETLAVPFFPSKRGDKGKHVRALNRALSKAGFRRWQVFSLTFNYWVERAVKRFQRANGLATTGIYNRATHEKLARYYDAYAIKYLLIRPIPKPTQDELERAAFLAEIMYVYNNRWGIGYTQARAYDQRRPPRGLDCSSTGEWSAQYSNFPSLSDLPRGYGNTHSQLSRYRRLSRIRESIRSALPGDPKYYGSSLWNPTHVAFYLGHKDGRARVASFGSYPMKILDAEYRHDGIAICNLTGR